MNPLRAFPGPVPCEMQIQWSTMIRKRVVYREDSELQEAQLVQCLCFLRKTMEQ